MNACVVCGRGVWRGPRRRAGPVPKTCGRRCRLQHKANRRAAHYVHKGRAVGERNGSAKLTWPRVARIRSLLAQGVSGAAVARKFGMSASLISQIKRRELWRPR